MQISPNQKIFSEFFSALQEPTWNLEYFEEKLSLRGYFFCHIFWTHWNKISSKNSVLVLSGILRLFLNILTPDEKYFLPGKASV